MSTITHVSIEVRFNEAGQHGGSPLLRLQALLGQLVLELLLVRIDVIRKGCRIDERIHAWTSLGQFLDEAIVLSM